MEPNEPTLRQPVKEGEPAPPLHASEGSETTPAGSRRRLWVGVGVGVLVLGLAAAALWSKKDRWMPVPKEGPSAEPSPIAVEKITRDVDQLRQKVGAQEQSLLEEVSEVKRLVRQKGLFPRVNLAEDSERFELTAEMPGYDREQVGIDVDVTSVHIHGTRKLDPAGKWILSERVDDKFERTVMLPSSIDPAKANAFYRDGLLTVILPKMTTEAAKVSPEIQP